MDRHLEACPFCRRRAAEVMTCCQVACCDDECYKCHSMKYFVVCNVNEGGCGAQGPSCDTAEEASRSWNDQ